MSFQYFHTHWEQEEDWEEEVDWEQEEDWEAEMENVEPLEWQQVPQWEAVQKNENDDQPLMAEMIPVPISRDHIGGDNNSVTSTCPICKEDFELGEEGGQLHCGHIFHKHCISRWLRLDNTCPVCRRAF